MKKFVSEILTYAYFNNHAGPVSGVALHGNVVLTSSYDGHLGFWKCISGQPIPQRFLYLHAKGMNCVTASPNGLEIATGGSDGTACIVLPGAEGARVLRCRHPVDVECVVFSSDGRFLLTGGTDGFARIFDVKTGKERFVIRHGATVGTACRHPDPELVITGCNDRNLRLIRWRDGRVLKVCSPHAGPVKAVTVCALGILSTGHDQRLILHDFKLQQPRELTRFSTTPKAMFAEPAGSVVWIGIYDQRLLRYQCLEGDLLQDISVRHSRFWAHGLAANSKHAVVGSFDGSPMVYTPRKKGPGTVNPTSRSVVPCISTSCLEASGSMLVAGDSGHIYSVDDSKASRFVSMAGAITSMVGHRHDLVVGTWDGVVARFCHGREVWRARWPASLDGGRRSPSPVLRVSRDKGRVLAGTYTHGWTCFREDDGEPLWHGTEASGAIKCVDLDGDIYAATGRYDPLRVGDARTGLVKARLNLATAVSDVVSISRFTVPERTRIGVCAGSNQVWIVDLYSNGTKWAMNVICRSIEHPLPVKALLWISEDQIVAGDYDGNIFKHQITASSSLLRRVDGRLGVSSLSLDNRGDLRYTTFDGGIGTINRADL